MAGGVVRGIMLGVVIASEYFGKAVLRWTGVAANGVVVVGAGLGLLVANEYLVGAIKGGGYELLGFWGGLAALYGLCAWRYLERQENVLSQVQQVLGMLMAGLCAVMVVHHGFTGMAWHRVWEAGLIEYGVMSVVLGLLGFGLTMGWRGRLSGYARLREGGVVYALISGLVAVLGVYVISNPLLMERGVLGAEGYGGVGWLWYVGVCCLPVVVLGLNGVVMRIGDAAEKMRRVMLGMMLLLVGMCGVLLVRQGFSDGGMLVEDVAIGLFEFATDSVVFLGLGMLMIVFGGRWVLRLFDVQMGGLVVGVLGVIAWALYCGVLENPLWVEVGMNGGVGERVVLNWLLYVYVLPVAMTGAMCWCIGKWGRDEMQAARGPLMKVVLIAMGAVLMLFVRQGFAGSDMRLETHGVGLLEWATDGVALIGLGGLLMVMRERMTGMRELLGKSGLIYGGVGLGIVVVMCGVKENPLWTEVGVGEMRVVNWLIYIYLLPVLLMGGVMWLGRDVKVGWAKVYKGVMGVVGLAVAFLWLSLEVRQGFVGGVLDLQVNDVSQYEWYGYSAAWIVFGVGLLGSGILLGNSMLRFASLAVMMVSTCKIFLFDMSHLEGFLKAGSFLGLGLTLMGLGLVYQKVVFGRKDEEEKNGESGEVLEED